MLARNVSDLEIYNLALQASADITRSVGNMPYWWSGVECRQIVRSASSVPANIAEGFGHRYYPRQFVRYLDNLFFTLPLHWVPVTKLKVI